MDFGSWEGREWSNIPKAELDAWADDFMHARPHGGESVAMLRKRVLAAVEDYKRHDGTQVLVCHAGVIKAVFAGGDDPGDYNFSPAYGGIFEIHE